MRDPKLRIFAALIVALLAATELAAQECDFSLKVEECWNSLRNAASAEVQQEAQTDQGDMKQLISDLVVAASPGASPTIPGAAATVADFLSRMRVSVDSGSLGEGAGEALVLELNDFLGLSTDDGYKIQALVREPKLSEKLVEALPATDRETRVSELQKELNDLDDVSVVATYSPMGKTMGRKSSLHATEQSLLFEAIRSKVSALTNEVFAKQFALIDVVDRLPVAAQKLIEDKGVDAALSSLSPEQAALLQDAFKAALGSRETRRAALLKELENNHFFAFADLIANQPQLYVNVEAASPNRLVGPQRVTGKLTYEGSWANVNKLRDSCTFQSAPQNETQPQKAAREANLVTCYSNFMTAERISAAQRGGRYNLAIELSDVEEIKPLPDVDFTIPADYKLVIQGALGRYLSFFKDGSGRSRIDFEAKHEDFGDDPNRQERNIATLTFSQKVAGEAVFTVGFVYADKPEFRGTVDKEISARFGLNYRLLRKGEI